MYAHHLYDQPEQSPAYENRKETGLTSRIIIVGAGIAGLSLAQWLTRFGIEFEIIEQSPSERRSPHGIVLPFNAVRELKMLGVFEQLQEEYFDFWKLTYCGIGGKEIKSAILTQSPFENEQFIAVREQRLLTALRTGLEKKIRYNTRLTDVDHGEDGVRISCTNELLNGQYDLIVAADGTRSQTRLKNFEGQITVQDHHIPCWRVLLEYPEHGLQPMHMIGPVSQFVIYPVSNDTLYCYAHVHEAPDGEHVADGAMLEEKGRLSPDPKENLRRIFARYGGPVPEILSRLGDAAIIPDRLQSVTEPCFFDRRIAFIGDAAHGCSPLIQQGAAMALADSRCLADALAMQQTDQALTTYRERREAQTQRIARASDAPLDSVLTGPGGMKQLFYSLKLRLFGPDNVRAWRRIATERPFQSANKSPGS